jgi:hypothetical protein
MQEYRAYIMGRTAMFSAAWTCGVMMRTKQLA